MVDAVVNPGEILSVEAPDGRRLKGRLWRADIEGPLLVAMHGVMSHSLWFHQFAHALGASGISLLAIDRRGAGMNQEGSGELEGDLTLIHDLKAWLDLAATIGQDIHLVGFCWGSNYALHYLGKTTEPIGSLILMAPGVVPAPKIAIRRSVDDDAPDEPVPIPLALEDFTHGPALDDFLRPDPLRLTHVSARFVRIQNQIGRWSAVRLVRTRLPLLMILAADDEISDNSRTRDLFEKSSAAPKELVEVPGRHGVIFDSPGETASACRSWLDRLDRHSA